uniref:Uncharacterized protein n=1 Tax=Aegilops tauschii TaxID=37682 RepID=R7W068_AEGTA
MGMAARGPSVLNWIRILRCSSARLLARRVRIAARQDELTSVAAASRQIAMDTKGSLRVILFKI